MKKLSKKVDQKKFAAQEKRRIAKANKEFEEATPAEKRVMIARDVIAQIEANTFNPAYGVWLVSKTKFSLFTEKDIEKGTQLQDILKTTECRGCAIGGLFMCAVKRANKLKVNELSEDSQADGDIEMEDLFRYMRRFFSLDQLNKIEAAFEQGNGAAEDEEAAQWLAEIDWPADRMRLLMENIIANNGSFQMKERLRPYTKWVTPGYDK